MTRRIEAYVQEVRRTAHDADTLASRLPHARNERVVNVHAYALGSQEAFLRRFYDDDHPRVACFSMNPAYHGAVQSGIAFTDAPTARELLPTWDRLVRRPRDLSTERGEMSGQKLRAWAERELGGLPGLYARVLFPIACPVAILRGPRRLNVPIATLRGRAHALADAFWTHHAARLAHAAAPTGVLLFGGYAAAQWRAVAHADPDLATLPVRAGAHPAARMANDAKFASWRRALEALAAPAST